MYDAVISLNELIQPHSSWDGHTRTYAHIQNKKAKLGMTWHTTNWTRQILSEHIWCKQAQSSFKIAMPSSCEICPVTSIASSMDSYRIMRRRLHTLWHQLIKAKNKTSGFRAVCHLGPTGFRETPTNGEMNMAGKLSGNGNQNRKILSQTT